MTVAEFVCMVSIFCIVLPQFVIAMTIIFYSETSIGESLLTSLFTFFLISIRLNSEAVAVYIN